MELDYESALSDFTVGDFLGELEVGPIDVILGELDPTLQDSLHPYDLNFFRQRGFTGVLLWQDYGHLYKINYPDFKRQVEKIRATAHPIEVNISSKQIESRIPPSLKGTSPDSITTIPLNKWYVHKTGGINDALWYKKIEHSNEAFEKLEIKENYADVMVNFNGLERKHWKGEAICDLDTLLDLTNHRIGLSLWMPKEFVCNWISNALQLILEDSKGRRLHSPWHNLTITDGDKWINFEYTPSTGPVALGKKEPDFSLNSIARLGFSANLGSGSTHKFIGQFRAGAMTVWQLSDSLVYHQPANPWADSSQADSIALVPQGKINLFSPENNWRRQTFLENAGVVDLELEKDGKLIVRLDLMDGVPAKNGGEIILDLARETDCFDCNYVDLRNRVLTLFIKNPADSSFLKFRLFVRDNNSQAIYGPEVGVHPGKEIRYRFYLPDDLNTLHLKNIEMLGIEFKPEKDSAWRGRLTLQSLAIDDTSEVVWNTFDKDGELDLLKNKQNEFIPQTYVDSRAISSVLWDKNKLKAEVNLIPSHKNYHFLQKVSTHYDTLGDPLRRAVS